MGYLFSVIFLLLVFAVNVAHAKSNPISSLNTEAGVEQAEQAFQRGDYENAIAHWSTMAQDYASSGDTVRQITALINLGQAYQAMGQNAASIAALHNASALVDKSAGQHQKIKILNSLGAAYVAVGEYQKATDYLQQAIDKATATNAPGLLAATLNNQGNLFTQQNKFDQAAKVYAESIRLADSSGHYKLAAKASVNLVIAAMKIGAVGEIETLLKAAQTQLEKTVDDHDKAYSWISLGQTAFQLTEDASFNHSQWQAYAHRSFTQAVAIGKAISDDRAISYATGNLGKLYMAEKRYDEAMMLTRQAIFALEAIGAPEILYRWQWQTARILSAKGNQNAAIKAYQQAISTLQPVRQGLAAQFSGDAAFHEELGSVYLELADLLLRSTDTMTDQEVIQQSLIAARDTMEQLKAAELQDYFQDDCVVELQKKQLSLEAVDRHTAAIYPILLENRTELLLSLPDGIKRFTVPVKRTVITQVVRSFRRNLENRTTREYLPQSQQLYQWLIAPLQSTLLEKHIDTLIIVPEQSLRTIPIAALHDGNHFLIESYAIATTPGLHLTDPKSFESGSVQVLASGLSEAVQGFSPLPYVTEELSGIQKAYGGQVLLNKDFLLGAVQRELKTNPYTIVHIASHGQFKKNTKENFVLTYDKKLTMDDLEQLITIGKFRDHPVELLVLSACQTAAGDDRAALGLAGIAIKAGARSAIATLWFINDKASSDLITEFYHQLKENRKSKAQALRQAQIHLINNTTNTAYHHPYYWSAFLLIGNWL